MANIIVRIKTHLTALQLISKYTCGVYESLLPFLESTVVILALHSSTVLMESG